MRNDRFENFNRQQDIPFQRGGIYQGQERDPSCAGVWRAQTQFVGQSFWARGYFVSTVGRDEAAIRDYIKNQEKEDQRLDQVNLWR